MTDSRSNHSEVLWPISDQRYQKWIDGYELNRRRRLISEATLRLQHSDVLISIVMPVYNTPEQFLRDALDSVLIQSYTNWQLCIVDDGSSELYIRTVLMEYQSKDGRITVQGRSENAGIAVATNEALALAKGQYVAFMDHDDVLAPHALLMVASHIQLAGHPQMLYSDSDYLNKAGERCQPYFKADWNYDLFLAQNYTNHLSVFRSELLQELGGLREGFDGSQDYELTLRVIEKIAPADIVHISEVLYHWRIVESSAARSSLGKAVKAARKAIREHFLRTGQSARVEPVKQAVIFSQVIWAVPDIEPDVAIILIGDSYQQLYESERKLKQVTAYQNVTFHWIVNASSGDNCTGLSDQINEKFSALSADLCCFMPCSFIAEDRTWLDILIGQVIRPSVGMVGAKLLTASGRLITAPVVQREDGGSKPTQSKLQAECIKEGDKGYFAHLALHQQVDELCLGGAVISRTLFQQLGGLAGGLSTLRQMGADLSQKVLNQGLESVWSAQVVLRSMDERSELLGVECSSHNTPPNNNRNFLSL